LRDWLKPETVPPKVLTGDYEDLPEATKLKYKTLSDDVDTYTTTILDTGTLATFSTNAAENKDKKASVIFGLDQETANLEDFSTNNTLNYATDETTDGMLESITNRGKDQAYKALNPYLSTLPSFTLFGPSLKADPAGAIKEWLKS
jgi:hypothetical protein